MEYGIYGVGKAENHSYLKNGYYVICICKGLFCIQLNKFGNWGDSWGCSAFPNCQNWISENQRKNTIDSEIKKEKKG